MLKGVFSFVRVTGDDGKRHDHIFGRSSKKAEFLYNQLIAEYCQNLNSPQLHREAVTLSIAELVYQYLETIREQYEPTQAFTDYKKAGELLSRLYGNLPATVFMIPHCQRLIRVMISNGFALRTINVRIGFVKLFFKHALDCEAITAEQFFKIKSVPRILLVLSKDRKNMGFNSVNIEATQPLVMGGPRRRLLLLNRIYCLSDGV